MAKVALVAKTAVAARQTEGAKQVVEFACQVTALALSSKESTFKALGPNKRGKMRVCLQNKACEEAALKGTVLDLKALSACPVNAMCLRAASLSTDPSPAVARKRCPLLKHSKALTQDKAALA